MDFRAKFKIRDYKCGNDRGDELLLIAFVYTSVAIKYIFINIPSDVY